MKRTTTTPESTQQPSGSDNLCKRLAEQFPADFARWAFGVTGSVKVDKTELSREPIRADAAIFSHDNKETLHAEFQTTMKSDGLYRCACWIITSAINARIPRNVCAKC